MELSNISLTTLMNDLHLSKYLFSTKIYYILKSNFFIICCNIITSTLALW